MQQPVQLALRADASRVAVESATGEIWSAAAGTGPNLEITNTTRLVEWRSWPEARDIMIRFARDFAEADDIDLKAAQDKARRNPDQFIPHERPSIHQYPTSTEALEAILVDNPPQVDEECHLFIESWHGERHLFVIENDSVGTTRGGH